MKLIFTLLTIILFGNLQAQFEQIVSRIRYEPDKKITLSTYICGFAYSKATLIDLPPSFPDIPSVRRSLEGLQLPLRETVHPRPLDTTRQNPVLVKQTMSRNIKLSCAKTIISTEPLLVVDGKLIDSLSYLNKLNPNDIEDITILKDAVAQAIYGCRASSGVIIVTTKSFNRIKIQILDEEDRHPIPGATVRFVSSDKKDTIQQTTNDTGFLFIRKPNSKKQYTLDISSVGYLPKREIISPYDPAKGGGKWMLSRNIISTQEAVISNIQCGRKRKITCCILGSTRCVIHQLSPMTQKKETKAFPNPARPGQTITIEEDLESAEKISLQVFHVSGALMGAWNLQAVKGLNQLRFTTGQHWAAGTYFFRILYAKGRVAASGSIIIQ